MDTVTKLEEDLKQAKSEAARNKEESKSVRKRLAGCHFHYKQLQEQYNATLKQKDDLDRQIKKAHKYDVLRQEQAESWKSQIADLREHRRISEEQIDRLTKENQELHTCCEDLLKLTAKSVEC
jgi:chromosome segregation ATPase